MRTTSPARRVALCVVWSALWFTLTALLIVGPGLKPHAYLAPMLASAGGSLGGFDPARSLKVIVVLCRVAGGLGLILCAVLAAGATIVFQAWSGGGDAGMIRAGAVSGFGNLVCYSGSGFTPTRDRAVRLRAGFERIVLQQGANP